MKQIGRGILLGWKNKRWLKFRNVIIDEVASFRKREIKDESRDVPAFYVIEKKLRKEIKV